MKQSARNGQPRSFVVFLDYALHGDAAELRSLHLRRLAQLNHERACGLADRLSAIEGVTLETDAFFNEFTLRLPERADGVVEKLAAKGVIGGVPASRLYPGEMADRLIIAATECNTDADVDAYEAALREVLK